MVNCIGVAMILIASIMAALLVLQVPNTLAVITNAKSLNASNPVSCADSVHSCPRNANCTESQGLLHCYKEKCSCYKAQKPGEHCWDHEDCDANLCYKKPYSDNGKVKCCYILKTGVGGKCSCGQCYYSSDCPKVDGMSARCKPDPKDDPDGHRKCFYTANTK